MVLWCTIFLVQLFRTGFGSRDRKISSSRRLLISHSPACQAACLLCHLPSNHLPRSIGWFYNNNAKSFLHLKFDLFYSVCWRYKDNAYILIKRVEGAKCFFYVKKWKWIGFVMKTRACFFCFFLYSSFLFWLNTETGLSWNGVWNGVVFLSGNQPCMFSRSVERTTNLSN